MLWRTFSRILVPIPANALDGELITQRLGVGDTNPAVGGRQLAHTVLNLLIMR